MDILNAKDRNKIEPKNAAMVKIFDSSSILWLLLSKQSQGNQLQSTISLWFYLLEIILNIPKLITKDFFVLIVISFVLVCSHTKLENNASQ